MRKAMFMAECYCKQADLKQDTGLAECTMKTLFCCEAYSMCSNVCLSVASDITKSCNQICHLISLTDKLVRFRVV